MVDIYVKSVYCPKIRDDVIKSGAKFRYKRKSDTTIEFLSTKKLEIRIFRSFVLLFRQLHVIGYFPISLASAHNRRIPIVLQLPLKATC